MKRAMKKLFRSRITGRRYLILKSAIVFLVTSSMAFAQSPETISNLLEEQVDRSVERALEYLAGTQQANGSWPSGFGANTGITSLAVMAFLAKGHTPGEGPYGKIIDKGIDFVLASQHENGYLIGKTSHGAMYSHGISTLMLAEVLGQTTSPRNERVREGLARAVRLILDAQKVAKPDAFKGGWRYNMNSADSDISCTGWQLMALRAAKNAGADVPVEAINDAVDYLKRSACPNGGFGYQPGGGPNLPRSGTGILGLELCGQHHLPESLKAGDYILTQGPKALMHGYIYYGSYYCSQGMYQLGGRYWDQFWPGFATAMLARQQPDGSFALGEGAEQKAGPVYSTAMAVLSLGVIYRAMPIYQR
jgi:hypothetical protein